MTKKKETSEKNAAKIAAEQMEERRKAISDFNMQNMGKYWIDPDRTPTDEDVKKAKEAFEERTKALQEKNDYIIADKENALRVAKFMKKFNDESTWAGRMFVGVFNFSALMDDFINGFDEDNPVDLVLEYGPMQYIFLVFDKYAGQGIEQAKKMAEIWDEYLPIYEKLHELIDWYNEEQKACNDLKEAWAMFEQGYYFVIMKDTEEDPTADNGTIVPGDLTKEGEDCT